MYPLTGLWPPSGADAVVRGKKGTMNETDMMSASHAVYSLRLHIVLVTKYRRKTLTPILLDALRDAFTEILTDWRCTLIEFGGEGDHVHLLVGIHPALNISVLIPRFAPLERWP